MYSLNHKENHTMTKQEERTIRNIIARLKKERCGCASPTFDDEKQANGYEGVARIYVDTWLIGPLECLLPEQRDPKLAERMSK